MDSSPTSGDEGGASRYWTTNGAVRTVPSDDRIVTVGLALGTTVVVVADSRQRPVTGTAVLPKVTRPLAVET
ncbi:hypothetical protein D3C81_2132350 [compost metagenome]